MVRLGISVLAVYELPGARKGCNGKKTGLSHIEIVIPMKVGIQIGKGLWIPVKTGMTVSKSLGICGSPVAKRWLTYPRIRILLGTIRSGVRWPQFPPGLPYYPVQQRRQYQSRHRNGRGNQPRVAFGQRRFRPGVSRVILLRA